MFKIKKLVCLIGGCSVLAMPVFAAQVSDGTEEGALQLAAAETASKLPRATSSNALIESLLDKARYWKARNRMDLAASTWERVLRSDPNQTEALAGLGSYQASIGRADLANEYLGRLKRVNPRHPAVGELERTLASGSSRTVPTPAAEVVTVDPAVAEKAKLRSQYLATLNQGNQARRQKRLEEAGTHFRAAAGMMPEMPEAPTALADLLLEQGDAAGAETGYRAVLNTHPGYPDATLGLARAFVKQGRHSDALSLIARLEPGASNPDRSAGVRAEAYMRMGEIAEEAGKNSDALTYYGNAKSLRPGDPWATLAYSRLLRKQGDPAAARNEIEQLTAKANDRDTNYAGALFYAEENQWVQTLALLDQIPAQHRNERIGELRSRAVVYVRSDLAKRLYSDGAVQDAIEMLSSAENDATGKPELVSRAAATWSDIGQPERAIALLERSKPLTPGLQFQYAGALLQANQDAKLGQLLNEMEGKEGISFKRGELDRIRIALAVRKADALRHEGKLAEGNDVLSPMLAAHPEDVDLLLAKARLQGAAGVLPDALKTVDMVLARSPGNHEAIRQGTEYAILQNDYALADKYLAGSSPADADRAALYVEAAHLAEARQYNEQAAKYYKAAEALGARVRQIDLAASPEQHLSMRGVEHKPYLEAGYASRYKSGLPGLSYLYERERPLAVHVPLEGKEASLVFKATHVTLDAGDAGLWTDIFGRNFPNPGPLNYPVTASGLALSAGYQSASLSADIGVSPIGFEFSRVVGGVRWNTDVAGSNIAVEVSRRSVTESVLSYAGAVDNVTGAAWGGVTRNGGQVSIYHPFGASLAGYASVGLYNYGGTSVASNASHHLSGSLIYQIERSEDREMTVAMRLSQTHYDRNQSWFFWGHGGYYSPQKEMGVYVPFHAAGNEGKLVYEFNLEGGTAIVSEDPASAFPVLDAALLAQLQQAVLLGEPAIRPGNARNAKGSWRTDWTVEYELEPKFTLGHRFHYEESRTYQQLGAMLYLRYDFDKKEGRRKFPPSPIRPYYITSQGGAGLN
jgi:predicted Zn-dependent protease